MFSLFLTISLELFLKIASLQLVAWAAYHLSICYIEAVTELARTLVQIADIIYSSEGRLQALR